MTKNPLKWPKKTSFCIIFWQKLAFFVIFDKKRPKKKKNTIFWQKMTIFVKNWPFLIKNDHCLTKNLKFWRYPLNWPKVFVLFFDKKWPFFVIFDKKLLFLTKNDHFLTKNYHFWQKKTTIFDKNWQFLTKNDHCLTSKDKFLYYFFYKNWQFFVSFSLQIHWFDWATKGTGHKGTGHKGTGRKGTSQLG